MQHPPRWPYRDMRAPVVPTPPTPPAYTPPSDPLLNPERLPARTNIGSVLRACFWPDEDEEK